MLLNGMWHRAIYSNATMHVCRRWQRPGDARTTTAIGERAPSFVDYEVFGCAQNKNFVFRQIISFHQQTLMCITCSTHSSMRRRSSDRMIMMTAIMTEWVRGRGGGREVGQCSIVPIKCQPLIISHLRH